MKIKTYVGRDMRQALRLVREDQGPEAVILSTRQVPTGIEVSAAIEPELAPALEAVDPTLRDTSGDFGHLLAQSVAAQAQVQSPSHSSEPSYVAELGSEVRTMRHLLEGQLAQLAWNDLTRRAPAIAELLKQLTELGLASSLATEILRELPSGIGIEDAQRRVVCALESRIAVTGDALLEDGGRVAFVGPTGVGKTTVIAKLAAHWVMRHGAGDIALISIDDQRFGAHEQLRVLGRLLGTECYCLDDVSELPALLGRLPTQRLILIDTAGASPRESNLKNRADAFKKISRKADIQTWLALSAGAQAGVLEQSVQRFSDFGPQSLIITKIDEAVSLGGVLSAIVTAGLPVSYVCDGPRIPEDLAPARAQVLVSRAAQLARDSSAVACEDLLARRFGGIAHGIA
jgi:flagellar biosynthesis protein FlhF